MSQSFPTSVPSYPDTTGSEVLGSAGGGLGLSRILDDYGLDITGLATKLGTGSDTAATNEVLVGTGAGTSGWSSTLAGLTLTAPVLSGSITGTYTLAGTPTITGATIATSLDMNGTELILDADADTSITADTDDQIDIRISGADDFRFTANLFEALSGSAITTPTLTVSSSLTIPNDSIDTAQVANGAIEPDQLNLGGTGADVATSQTTTSTSFTDLATTGPAATVTIGANGVALVIVSCSSNSSDATGANMSYAVSGASTVAASATNAALTSRNANDTNTKASLQTGLTAGSNTFTAKYNVPTSGTGTFADRRIIVIPL